MSNFLRFDTPAPLPVAEAIAEEAPHAEPPVDLAQAKAQLRAFLSTLVEPQAAPVVTVAAPSLPPDPQPLDLIEALDWKKEPHSVLAGTAGTGKTFFAKDWAASTKGITLAATTGIAAVNLGGQTINGLLSFFDTASLRDGYVSGFLEARLRKLHRSGLRRILLDEMSMLDGEQLTILTKALDEVAGRGYAFMGGDQDLDVEEDEADNPEDPIGLTLVGDFAQLPPVKAPFAFESPEWERFAAHTLRLRDIRRQTDRDFIEALQATRRGDVPRALEYFADRFESAMDKAFEGPTLLARNEQVERYNDLRLAALQTPAITYTATSWTNPGVKPRSEWKQIPQELRLKEGALVMILANLREDDETGTFTYVNGDLGEVVDRPSPDIAVVHLHRTKQEVRVGKITRDIQIPLEVGRAKQLRKEGLGDRINGKYEITGGITYMPLRLAYATTVHKSQGLSLDQVQVNLNDYFFSTPGMVYVALSRARASAGLRLVGSPNSFTLRCQVDPKVRGWL